MGHAEPPPPSDAERRRGIVLCIAAMFAVSAALGITWPFLALVLERQGVSPAMNGLSAAAQMSAVVLIAPLGPRLVGRFGTVGVMGAGLAGSAICIVLISTFRDVWIWFPLRFALGFFVELVYMGGDVWINQVAAERNRGRVLAVFSLFLHGGFALGPVAIGVLGAESWAVMHLGAAVVALGVIPVLLARGVVPAIEGEPKTRVLHFLRIAPSMLIAALMFGLVESSVFSLMPVYGVDLGLDEESAAYMVTVFVLGGMAMQLPVGWLSDHMNRRVLLAINVGISTAMIALLPLVMDVAAARWAILFAMGGALGTIYEIALAMMGSRFRDADLVGMNASFVLLWGIGMMSGPLLAGAAMQTLGPIGLPVTAGGFCALFFVFLLARIRAVG